MLSNAFKSVYTNQVSQQAKGVQTITSGVKDTAIAALGALGFSGALGEGAVAQGAQHTLAGRIGGVGGNIMLATLNEKKETAQAQEAREPTYTKEQIQSALGENPINRSAIKQLNTVFDTLQMAKQQDLLSKKGQIKTSMGEVDPTSELGKKILGGLKNDND